MCLCLNEGATNQWKAKHKNGNQVCVMWKLVTKDTNGDLFSPYTFFPIKTKGWNEARPEEPQWKQYDEKAPRLLEEGAFHGAVRKKTSSQNRPLDCTIIKCEFLAKDFVAIGVLGDIAVRRFRLAAKKKHIG